EDGIRDRNVTGVRRVLFRSEKEIQTQTRKFIIGAILTLPLLWTMVAHFSFLSFIYLPDFLMHPWVQLVLATPVQFYVGAQFYKEIGRASCRDRVYRSGGVRL